MNEERIKRDVIVIGASAGGVKLLQFLCAELEADLPAVMGIVIHRSPWFQSDVSGLYGAQARVRVREAKAHDPLEHGTVYFAPADHHMLFTNVHVELSREAKVHFSRPSVDRLFVSAAAAYGNRVAAVLLSGGGSDGAHGFIKIKAGGGLTLVQLPEEASHPMMPLAGIREDSPSAAVSMRALPRILAALARGEKIHIEKPGFEYDNVRQGSPSGLRA